MKIITLFLLLLSFKAAFTQSYTNKLLPLDSNNNVIPVNIFEASLPHHYSFECNNKTYILDYTGILKSRDEAGKLLKTDLASDTNWWVHNPRSQGSCRLFELKIQGAGDRYEPILRAA